MNTFDYMMWAKSLHPAKYNLARSGVQQLHLSDLDIDYSLLDVNGPNAYGFQVLINAIADRYNVKSSCVILTQGASFANSLINAALIQPGDEVIVEQPAYEVLYKLPQLFHAHVKRLQRRFKNGFQVDPADLEKLISPNTRLIVLTNMHNPSGVRITNQALVQLGQIADKCGAKILVDEVYLETYYSERPPVAASLGKAFITTSSLTKAFGLDGMRCGWIICEEKLADELRKLNDFFGVAGVFIAEQIGAHAFQKLDSIGKRLIPQLEQNLKLMDDFVETHQSMEWVRPDGGIIAFPRLISNETNKFPELLRSKYDISIVPGHFFEMPKHFRIAWGVPQEHFKNALDTLDKYLAY